MYACQTICQVILRQHDLFDPCKVLRLVVFHPQNLRRGKSGEGDVCRVFGKLLLADHLIQIVVFPEGSAIVPENRGTDDLIVFIQHN